MAQLVADKEGSDQEVVNLNLQVTAQADRYMFALLCLKISG